MIIYTDGSAHPNPGPGGFGVVICDDENNILDTYSHHELATTNNIQELKAILYAMINYGIHESEAGFMFPTTVYSDSNYAVKTFNEWMFNWEKNGWIKSDKKVPENLELIQAYYNLYKKGYRINLQKIKGHNGNKGNDLADKLATGKISEEEAKNVKII